MYHNGKDVDTMNCYEVEKFERALKNETISIILLILKECKTLEEAEEKIKLLKIK